MKKRVVFLSGTRADFGKIKSLIRTLLQPPFQFDVHIFATGMHMEPKYGFTVEEIQKCGFPNIYRFINQSSQGLMDRSLAHTVLGFGDYVRLIQPDLIVVHGDRVEALAGAMVGALSNVRVAHIEGGEISGTVDELIRHSVTKMSHIHFVSNEEAKRRLVQLGEPEPSIHVIGSPDVDIMNSPDLPSLDEVKAYYEIDFDRYGILVFHPVTTSVDGLREETRALLHGVLDSGRNWVAIYPNSDLGSDIILEEYDRLLRDRVEVRLFPSLRFESMLVLLKYAELIVGNSSMGIREAPYYGVPTVNVGSRQAGRSANPNIVTVAPAYDEVRGAIDRAAQLRTWLKPVQEFGRGDSHQRFRAVLERGDIWGISVQKQFCDLPITAFDRNAA
ncbi:MAG: UDP-N-acetylglucosamine 2-epimerase [Myxococcota bacterium]